MSKENSRHMSKEMLKMTEREDVKYESNLEEEKAHINHLIGESRRKIVQKKFQEAIETLFHPLKKFLEVKSSIPLHFNCI
jgi:hypothetical protein